MQKRRRTVAWLAILALLINALVPASVAAAAAGKGLTTVSGWCGAGSGGHQPDEGSALPICNHCILCAAAAGFGPVAIATLSAAPTAIPIADGLAPLVLLRRPAYRPAQPRGPPVAPLS